MADAVRGRYENLSSAFTPKTPSRAAERVPEPTSYPIPYSSLTPQPHINRDASPPRYLEIVENLKTELADLKAKQEELELENKVLRKLFQESGQR